MCMICRRVWPLFRSDNMDIWDQLYAAAAPLYHPDYLSPRLEAHRVACALEAADGQIYTGFNIDSACGVMNLCAERVAALAMITQSGQTVIKRLLVCRATPPKDGDSMPCGACREFFLQLNAANRDMEILVDFDRRETITLDTLCPHWWLGATERSTV